MRLLPDSVKPSDAIVTDVSDARVARLWSNVSERLNPRRRWPYWLAAGAAATAAALVLVLMRPSAPAERAGPVVGVHETVAAEQQQRRVVLSDGSALELEPRTQVFVAKHEPTALELDLKNGAVTCDVAHVAGRQFVVRAGLVKVIAVGTRFSVSSHGGPVAVAVQQGVVEIHSGGRSERLAAGQRWTSGEPAAVASSAPAVSPPARAPGPALPNGSSTPAESPEVADARKLFETANHARRAGDMRAAATAYESLLRRFPSDGRATLAAFELGRLRMDHLGDTAGAISALNRAASAGGGSVREDAMARLVRAYAATGARDRCLRARERYERSYPEGHHGAEVRAACGPH